MPSQASQAGDFVDAVVLGGGAGVPWVAVVLTATGYQKSWDMVND
jgi:hypothetical protein